MLNVCFQIFKWEFSNYFYYYYHFLTFYKQSENIINNILIIIHNYKLVKSQPTAAVNLTINNNPMIHCNKV